MLELEYIPLEPVEDACDCSASALALASASACSFAVLESFTLLTAFATASFCAFRAFTSDFAFSAIFFAVSMAVFRLSRVLSSCTLPSESLYRLSADFTVLSRASFASLTCLSVLDLFTFLMALLMASMESLASVLSSATMVLALVVPHRFHLVACDVVGTPFRASPVLMLFVKESNMVLSSTSVSFVALTSVRASASVFTSFESASLADSSWDS